MRRPGNAHGLTYEQALAIVGVEPAAVADPDLYREFHRTNLAAVLG